MLEEIKEPLIILFLPSALALSESATAGVRSLLESGFSRVLALWKTLRTRSTLLLMRCSMMNSFILWQIMTSLSRTSAMSLTEFLVLLGISRVFSKNILAVLSGYGEEEVEYD